MGNKYVDFALNCGIKNIQGSDLYYYQIGFGKEKNLWDKYKDYLVRKQQENCGVGVASQKKGRILNEYAWCIIKKGENETEEELVDRIKDGAAPLGNLLFSPVNNDMSLDVNGNLLIKTYNSGLEDVQYKDFGDTLIDRNGDILIKPRFTDNYLIQSADKYGNYPLDVFQTKLNKETGENEVVGREKNFMFSDGRMLVAKDKSFPIVYDEEQEYIFSVDRKFRCIGTNGRPLIIPGVYPEGYVYGSQYGKVEYYPSAIDIIEENSRRIGAGLPEIEEEQGHYMTGIVNRLDSIDEVTAHVGKLFDNNTIDEHTYQTILDILNAEYTKTETFIRDNELTA